MLPPTSIIIFGASLRLVSLPQNLCAVGPGLLMIPNQCATGLQRMSKNGQMAKDIELLHAHRRIVNAEMQCHDTMLLLSITTRVRKKERKIVEAAQCT